MKEITVLPIGTKVTIGCERERIAAEVQAITIRGESVTYEVVWWSGRERKEAWIPAGQVNAVSDQPRMQVGFR